MSIPAPLRLPALSVVATEDLDRAIQSGDYDAVVLVGAPPLSAQAPETLRALVAAAEKADAPLASRAHVALVPAATLPCVRVVLASTGPLDSWEVDVRGLANAAMAGVLRAALGGAQRPLLVPFVPADARFAQGTLVAALASLAGTWLPYELRAHTERPPRLERLGVVGELAVDGALALERARVVARDLCGTEPELMSPIGMATYVKRVFEGTSIEVTVDDDITRMKHAFPLVHAVARASLHVDRHHPRLVRLVYEPEGPVTRTLFFAGKGVSYDTGGADLKTEGHMAGMSRDKGGAAAVAGLFRALAERRPAGVRVVGLLGCVRNSVGSDAYVTDEIVTARSGARVRIGNTDAEGRLVLADVLAALREEAETAVAPALFSIATLTGHAALAHGPYTALVPNGFAASIVDALVAAGEAYGDPCERSTLRPEDYAFIVGRSPAEDVLSCNSAPSARTPRGHQFPAAFLDVVSGLRTLNASGKRIPFVHLDIAGSALRDGGWQTGIPTAAPVLALVHGLGL